MAEITYLLLPRPFKAHRYAVITERYMTTSVLEAYQLWADSYDDMPNPTRDLDGQCLREDLEGATLGRILEVGCGTGKNTQWLTSQGPVVGLDFSSKMLNKCRVAAPAATVHLADINDTWPVEDDSVDTVLFDLVVEHIESLDHIVRESARVMRPHGRVRLSELHPYRQAEGKTARFDHAGIQVRVPAYMHSTEDYLEAFRGAGFDLRHLREPRADTDEIHCPPRLFIVEFSYAG